MDRSTPPRAGLDLDGLLDALIDHGHLAAQLLSSRERSSGLYRRLSGGIPPVQLQALLVLSGGDMRMRELAHRLGLATSTVTRLVDRLEAAGLAERRAERPDRRSVLVGLTSGGREALSGAGCRVRELLGQLVAGLTPGEQAELVRLLSKLWSGVVAHAAEPASLGAR